jgi:disulfide bond formation protein DsbB
MNMDSLDRPMTVPSCTDAPFYILGLSMAGWNGLVSAFLAAASFIAAGATFRGRNEA